jgi:hypothetical protein
MKFQDCGNLVTVGGRREDGSTTQRRQRMRAGAVKSLVRDMIDCYKSRLALLPK